MLGALGKGGVVGSMGRSRGRSRKREKERMGGGCRRERNRERI